MSLRNIVLMGRKISYVQKRNRLARGLRLLVHSDGRVVVTAPRRVPQFLIDRFLKNKAGWLFSKIDLAIKSGRAESPETAKSNFNANKKYAMELALNKIAHFNAIYNFNVRKVTIRNQRTRWGSCSKKGNISLNYKIVLLPQRLVDYIVVHEICHLGEMNHGQRFWRLVEKMIPDYLERRKELGRLRLL